jgi:uncharacterized membrane protein
VLALLGLIVILSLLRVIFFHTYSLIYLLWNILLALIPYWISLFMLRRREATALPLPLAVIGSVLWLLFIPNAPYLVTDLIHITHLKQIPIIFDTFLIFTSAWIGVLLYCKSVYNIEQILRMKYSSRATSYIIAIISMVVSFGIYLGRFLRFNSWDVLANPLSLYGGVRDTLSYQSGTNSTVAFIVLSAVFVFTAYQSWRYSNQTN